MEAERVQRPSVLPPPAEASWNAVASRVEGFVALQLVPEPIAATDIRIEAMWLAIEPLDMRAGTDTALARVVKVFGSARSHHAYLFANRRANRLKVLVNDGLGIWLAARRLHQGRFVWPLGGVGEQQSPTHAQLQALMLGLPWQRIGDEGVIGLV